MLLLTGVVLSGAALCGSPAHPHIAEVFYDAAAADTDREFVELLNSSPLVVPLRGLRLESGDGAGAGRWTLRWTGAADDTIAPGARFVVGGALVVPTPQAVAALNLQNGPDAVRLVWPDGVVEVVGYGTHAFGEYACGAPAPDVASGLSLARTPDDSRLGSNALDFRPALPSPGAINEPRIDLALEPVSLVLEPEHPDAGAPSVLRGAVRNRGRLDVLAGAGLLSVLRLGTPLAGIAAPAAAVAPGESVHFAVPLPGMGAGLHRVVARIALPGDEAAANDADSIRFRVGPGPLEITEIQFHPASGEGEWVEVANRSGSPIDLAAYSFSDRTGRPAPPRAPPDAAPLQPDSLAVLAQRRVELLAHYPGLDASRVWEVAPWSALNNSDGEEGIADAAVVRDAEGLTSDRVEYSGAGVPDGVPIERRNDAWWPSLQAGGSPLHPPIVPPPLRGWFQLSPRRIADPREVVSVQWDVVWPRSTATMRVYDLTGRIVASPFERLEIPARGQRAWSPATLRPGIYIVALEIEPSDRGERLVATQSFRIVSTAP